MVNVWVSNNWREERHCISGWLKKGSKTEWGKLWPPVRLVILTEEEYARLTTDPPSLMPGK